MCHISAFEVATAGITRAARLSVAELPQGAGDASPKESTGTRVDCPALLHLQLKCDAVRSTV